MKDLIIREVNNGFIVDTQTILNVEDVTWQKHEDSLMTKVRVKYDGGKIFEHMYSEPPMLSEIEDGKETFIFADLGWKKRK